MTQRQHAQAAWHFLALGDLTKRFEVTEHGLSGAEAAATLPDYGQQAARPRWSPDGRSLLYIGWNDSGLSTRYVIDVETGVVNPFSPHTDVTHRQNDADWSLDGKKVFYIQRVDKDQNKLNLYIMAESRGSDDEKLLFQTQTT